MITDNKLKDYKYFDKLKYINEDSVILDLGANIGDVTNYLFSKFKCNIYCYEPNIICFNYMKERFKNNHKIRIFNLAVSNFSGKGNLYFHKNSKGNYDVNYFEGATLRKNKDNIDINKKIKIKVLDIKEILSDFKIVDLIKIDVEGSEYLIMPEIIKNMKKIRRVVCETHGNPNRIKYGKKWIKNRQFIDDYNNLVSELKKKKLYNDWFVEWH